MTCIVGMVHNSTVHFGADSAAVDSPNNFVEQWKTPKVFKRGDLLFAFAGSYTVGQLLRLSMNMPEIKDLDIETYLVTKFIPAFKKLLNKEDIKEGTEANDWTILIGYRDRFFVLENEFGLGEPLEGYTADGSGRDYALGALSAVMGISPNLPPQAILELALKAAEKYSQNVKGPFIFSCT